MRICLRSRPAEEGNVLLTALVVTAIMGSVLAYSLSHVQTVTRLSARSQDWNIGIGLAEAGIEEALAHLQYNYTNRVSQGWSSASGTTIALERSLGANKFYVTIVSNATTGTRSTNRISSAASVYLPSTGKYLCRTVAVDVVATVAPPMGLVAKNGVTFKGNGSFADSYDSTDPTKSTGGAYDPAKRQANAKIGCVNGNFDMGNGDVFGKLIQGPGVLNLSIHKNSTIGDLAWHAGGNKGIQPGASVVDPSLSAPDVSSPFASAPTPPSATVGGVSYDAVLDDGNYMLPNIAGTRLLVRGKAVLYVQDYVSITSAKAPLTLGPGATLELFVGGTYVTIKAVQVTAGTGNLLAVYGLPSVATVDVATSAGAPVYINAPNATFNLGGGDEFYGAVVCKDFNAHGTPEFHFDEAMRTYYSQPKFELVSWLEP